MPDPVAPVAPPAAPPADSGRVEIPNNPPAPPAAPTYPEFATLVPAEFKDKPWVKETKDVPSLFKRFDGMLTEMGKKPAGIPQDNAKPEEVAAFNKAFGVPEAPDKYELVVPAEGGMPKEMLDGVKGVFHKAGLSAKQAKMVSEGWNAMVAEQLKAAGVQTEAQDANFETLATEIFAERKAEALATSKALLEKYAPEKFKAHINSLSNENLITMAAVLDGIRKDYISEDQLPRGGNGTGVGADARTRAFDLMKTDAYKNSFHPDHDKVKKEVDTLYASLKK